MTSKLRAVSLLCVIGIAMSARAEPLPTEGRFNLHCSIAVRTVSGPPLPPQITANYAVDLKSGTWCAVDDHCAERYRLHQVSASLVEFTVQDSFANSEKFLVNLETGKLAGHADDATRGLSNGFRTYLAEGDCTALPYAEGRER